MIFEICICICVTALMIAVGWLASAHCKATDRFAETLSELATGIVEDKKKIAALEKRLAELENYMETAAENERKFQMGLDNLLAYDMNTAYGAGKNG